MTEKDQFDAQQDAFSTGENNEQVQFLLQLQRHFVEATQSCRRSQKGYDEQPIQKLALAFDTYACKPTPENLAALKKSTDDALQQKSSAKATELQKFHKLLLRR